MSLLLCIDTATENAGVCFSSDGKIIASKKSEDQKNHASFVQTAIAEIKAVSRIDFNDLNAIAVTQGPGSYTGLRVGLATAKGFCYALRKPLILLNTLEVMARGSKRYFFNDNSSSVKNILFGPMIDARRMEVFTSVYDGDLNVVMQPTAMILESFSFQELLKENKIVFSGSGHHKLENLINHHNAIFQKEQYNITDVASSAALACAKKEYADVAYSEPFYLKEFFTKSSTN